MKPLVSWLGGWASDLRCWEPQLRELYPGFEHRFVDSHEFLASDPESAGLTASAGAEKPEKHLAAGWSLGSLLGHHWMAQGLWPESLPFLSLCPVFSFTRGAFGEPVILRMEDKLAADRRAVLRDFWRRMPRAGDIPPAWEENWLEGTARHSQEQLVEGLEFLRRSDLDPGRLRAPRRWELLAGDKDRLAPVGDWAAKLPSGAKLEVYPGGHLPFWECPEMLGAALERLAA